MYDSSMILMSISLDVYIIYKYLLSSRARLLAMYYFYVQFEYDPDVYKCIISMYDLYVFSFLASGGSINYYYIGAPLNQCNEYIFRFIMKRAFIHMPNLK